MSRTREKEYQRWILKEYKDAVIVNSLYFYTEATASEVRLLYTALKKKDFDKLLKKCGKCNEYLPLDNFSGVKNRNYTDNKLNICKSCRNDFARIQRQSDFDKQILYQINNNNRLYGTSITPEMWKDCLKFFNYTDAYTGDSESCSFLDVPRNLSIDHIIPTSKCGQNVPWNIVPVTARTNSEKGAKWLDEWLITARGCNLDRLMRIKEWQVFAYKKYKQVYAVLDI